MAKEKAQATRHARLERCTVRREKRGTSDRFAFEFV
jgi:hypothetical protein